MNTHPLVLALSVSSGFNARELIIPLKAHLEADQDIAKIICFSPAAPHRAQIFPSFGDTFEFLEQPADESAFVNLLRAKLVDIVVTPTTGLDPYDVPLLRAGKAAGIPTFTYISSWDNVFKMWRAVQWKREYELADQMAVWNTLMAEHLFKIFPQLSSDSVRVVGAIRFDFFNHHDRIPSRAELCRRLNVSPASKLIHLASTELYPLDYVVKTTRQAVDLYTASPVALYVSVHPGGTLAAHQTAAKKYGATIGYSFGRHNSAPVPSFQYNPSLEDIYMLVALFKHADLLINQSSTVSIESVVADVPVINVRYGRRFDVIRWRRSMVYRDFYEQFSDIIASGATKVVSTRADLITAIHTYLDHPEADHNARQALAQKMITTTDGTAGQKLLNLIKYTASK